VARLNHRVRSEAVQWRPPRVDEPLDWQAQGLIERRCSDDNEDHPSSLIGAVGKARRRSRIESAIAARSAGVYAGFLLSHLRCDMVVLDCGCGKGTIAIGLAEAVPAGRVVCVDLEKDSCATRPVSAIL
jgi:2-polyprenyl-3-methyl-5-hydroxy-6-metoxy-1,4-benzoquinol methylase